MKFRPFLLQAKSRRSRRTHAAHRARAQRLSFATAALLTSLASPALGQSGWFFGASQNIQGDDDVFTAGADVWALNNATSSATINGVEFNMVMQHWMGETSPGAERLVTIK